MSLIIASNALSLIVRLERRKVYFIHCLRKVYFYTHITLIILTQWNQLNKNYEHLFIVDNFIKFVWLYSIKSTTSSEIIVKRVTEDEFR